MFDGMLRKKAIKELTNEPLWMKFNGAMNDRRYRKHGLIHTLDNGMETIDMVGLQVDRIKFRYKFGLACVGAAVLGNACAKIKQNSQKKSLEEES